MINGSNYLANRYCDLCNLRIDRFQVSYSVNVMKSEDKRYNINEIKIVCRNCYLTSNRIARIGALIK